MKFWTQAMEVKVVRLVASTEVTTAINQTKG